MPWLGGWEGSVNLCASAAEAEVEAEDEEEEGEAQPCSAVVAAVVARSKNRSTDVCAMSPHWDSVKRCRWGA
jgi:hypothetical protein